MLKNIVWIVLAALFLAACGSSVDTVDGKTAKEWKAEAKKAQAMFDKFKKYDEERSLVSVLGAQRLLNSPCFKFTMSDDEDQKKQLQICENWIARFKKQVENEDAKRYDAQYEARQQIWENYPDLMTRYLVIQDKLMYLGRDKKEFDSLKKEQEELLRTNASFASLFNRADDFSRSPANRLKQKLHYIREAHEAIGKYITETRKEP